MAFGRKKPALERTTSEHLSTALLKFRDELRRAGAGKPPEPEELLFLRELAEDMRRLARNALDAELRRALERVAETADSLVDPPRAAGPIIDIAGGGG